MTLVGDGNECARFAHTVVLSDEAVAHSVGQWDGIGAIE